MAALAVLRLAAAWREWGRERIGILAGRWALVLAGLAAVGFLMVTADLGGGLVYQHGIAVRRFQEPLQGMGPGAAPTAPPGAVLPGPASAPSERLATNTDGTLEWRPLPGDREALAVILRRLGGEHGDAVSWSEAAKGDTGGTLEARGRSLLVLPGEFGDVQVEAELDVSGFEGRVGVAHHVLDAEEAGVFWVSTAGRAGLEDHRNGRREELDDAKVEMPSRRFLLAVSAARRHLKGLLDGRTVLHGHAAQPEKGQCGIFLDGTGTVRVFSLRVVPLHE